MSGDDSSAAPDPPRPRTFAEKLTRLSEVMHAPGEGPVTNRELQERIQAAGGSISGAYLSELRSGKKTNPTLQHIQWLAKAFGVAAGYFTDDDVAVRVDRELDRLEGERRDAELEQIALRTVGMVSEVDPSDRDRLMDLVREQLARQQRADDGADSQ